MASLITRDERVMENRREATYLAMLVVLLRLSIFRNANDLVIAKR
ncbi:hypothetical protein PP707_04450 [Acetobacter pasteurianus]|nr:hypothetical protein [Acetobacter pasteurianus]